MTNKSGILLRQLVELVALAGSNDELLDELTGKLDELLGKARAAQLAHETSLESSAASSDEHRPRARSASNREGARRP